MKSISKVQKLTESAILLAAATALSFVQFPGPWVNGGSITLCSMLPVCIIGYRYGVKWGGAVGRCLWNPPAVCGHERAAWRFSCNGAALGGV